MSQRQTTRQTTASIERESTCPECDGTVLPDGYERVCVECGVVVSTDPIDHGPEWNVFGGDTERKRRVGAPRNPALHDHGLSTCIGHGYSIDDDAAQKRQRKYHSQSKMRSKAERNQAYAFTEIRRMTSALDLSKTVRDRACRLFRAAQDADLILGRTLEQFASAAIYAACREQRVVCPADEIATVTVAETSNIRSAMWLIASETEIEVPPFTAADHVPRIVSEFDLSDATEHAALTLAKQAVEAGVLNGRSPSKAAAACVYVAGDGLRQTTVAEAADASAATVRHIRDAMRDADLC